jgi:hypothetical protein
MATSFLVPMARAVFYGPNATPLAGGFVYTYVPNSTTPKTTWQDSGQTTPNQNPIVLDANGSALIYGSGNYQITVTDAQGNAIPAYSGLSADTSATSGISSAMLPIVGAASVSDATTALLSPGFSLDLNGAPLSATFIGSGDDALFAQTTSITATSATIPEVGAQFTINSDVGLTNFQTAYKIALTASVVGGAASASIYGLNTIVQGFGGSYLVTGIESDVNNVGVDAIDVGAATSVYGLVSVASGSAASTAGLWVQATAEGSWTHGVIINQANLASFTDISTATIGLNISGEHTTGISMLAGFPIAISMALPNNAPIQQRDAGNTLRNVVNVTGSNQLALGDAGLASIASLQNFQPFSDNTLSLGASGIRWTAVWAANGTIQTSDVSQKVDVQPLPSVLSTILSVDPITFRWSVGGRVAQQTTEEQSVPATEMVAEEAEQISVVNGKAVLKTVQQEKEREIFDTLPVVDAAGSPVMDAGKTVPIRDASGAIIPGKFGVSAPTPRMHRVRRMTTKSVPVTQYVDKPGKRIHWGFSASDIKTAFDNLGRDFGGYVKGEDGTEGIRPDQLIPVLWKGIQEMASELVSLKAKIQDMQDKHPGGPAETQATTESSRG